MGQSTDAIHGWGIAFEDEGMVDYDAVEKMYPPKRGVDVFTHCSGEYPMLGFALQRTVANRGYPKKLKPATLPADAHERILKAIAAYVEACGDGLEEDLRKKLLAVKEKDLGWFICSDWG